MRRWLMRHLRRRPRPAVPLAPRATTEPRVTIFPRRRPRPEPAPREPDRPTWTFADEIPNPEPPRAHSQCGFTRESGGRCFHGVYVLDDERAPSELEVARSEAWARRRRWSG